MIHFPRPSHFFPEVRLTLRAVTPTEIPNVVVKIIEEYAEVEWNDALKEGLSKLQYRFWAKLHQEMRIQNYIPLETLRFLLGNDRFEIVEKARLIYRHIFRNFVLHLQSFDLSLHPEKIDEISVLDALNDPSKYAYNLNKLVENCRDIKSIVPSKLLYQLSKLSPSDRSSIIESELILISKEKQKLINPKEKEALNCCKEIIEIVKDLFEFVDFIQQSPDAKKEYLHKAKSLIAKDLNFIFLIPEFLCSCNVDPLIAKEISLFLIKTDFGGCARQLKGKVVLLMMDKDVLRTPVFINLAELLSVTPNELTDFISFDLSDWGPRLIDKIARRELIAYEYPKSDKSLCSREFKILKRFGAAPVFIIRNIVFSSLFNLPPIDILNTMGIVPKDVIYICKNSLDAFEPYYRHYLDLILLMMKDGAQISIKDRMEIEKEISPVDANNVKGFRRVLKKIFYCCTDKYEWARKDHRLKKLILQFRLTATGVPYSQKNKLEVLQPHEEKKNN